MNTWELRYDSRVRRRLQQIRNRAVVQRLEQAARRLRERPRLGKPLRRHPKLRSYRVGTPEGEYRIIYTLISQDRIVLVVLIAPRDEVYELLERLR